MKKTFLFLLLIAFIFYTNNIYAKSVAISIMPIQGPEHVLYTGPRITPQEIATKLENHLYHSFEQIPELDVIKVSNTNRHDYTKILLKENFSPSDNISTIKSLATTRYLLAIKIDYVSQVSSSGYDKLTNKHTEEETSVMLVTYILIDTFFLNVVATQEIDESITVQGRFKSFVHAMDEVSKKMSQRLISEIYTQRFSLPNS